MTCDVGRIYDDAWRLLGDSERESVRAHLRDCAGCRDAAAQIRREWELLGAAALKVRDTVPTLVPFPDERRRQPRSARPGAVLPLAYAAAFFVGLAGLYAWVHRPPAEHPAADPPATVAESSQDGPPEPVEALLSLLKDPDPARRDQARRRLVDRGDEARVAIEKALSSDLGDARPEAIEILKDLHLRDLFRDPRRIRFSARAQSAAAFFAELSRQSHVSVAPGPAADLKVTLDLVDVPLLQALDSFCRAYPSYGWRQGEEGTVRIVDEPAPIRSFTYWGPLRIRIQHLELLSDLRCALTLAADVDRSSARTSPAFVYEIQEVRDREGRILADCRLPGDGGNPPLRYRGERYSRLTVGVQGDPRGGSLKGRGKAVIPLRVEDVAIDLTQSSRTLELGAFRVRWMRNADLFQESGAGADALKMAGAGNPGFAGAINVLFDGPLPDAVGALDEASFRLDGRPAKMLHGAISRGTEAHFTYSVLDPGRTSKELRFRFTTDFVVKEFDFEMNDLTP